MRIDTILSRLDGPSRERRDDRTLEQRREITEILSARAVPFEVDTEVGIAPE